MVPTPTGLQSHRGTRINACRRDSGTHSGFCPSRPVTQDGALRASPGLLPTTLSALSHGACRDGLTRHPSGPLDTPHDALAVMEAEGLEECASHVRGEQRDSQRSLAAIPGPCAKDGDSPPLPASPCIGKHRRARGTRPPDAFAQTPRSRAPRNRHTGKVIGDN